MVPVAGEGISVSTLSVETSRRGSSTLMVSPTFLSQRVTVPSVTDSPSAGIVTTTPAPADTGTATTGAGASATTGAATGASAARGATTTTGVSTTGAATTGATGAAATPSSITASSAPTATVESMATTMRVRVPETGEGISVSTLSVDTSRRGSSTLTWSPSFLSQRVTVPSVTDSPSAGMVTEKVIALSPITRERAVVCRLKPYELRP